MGRRPPPRYSPCEGCVKSAAAEPLEWLGLIFDGVIRSGRVARDIAGRRVACLRLEALHQRPALTSVPSTEKCSSERSGATTRWVKIAAISRHAYHLAVPKNVRLQTPTTRQPPAQLHDMDIPVAVAHGTFNEGSACSLRTTQLETRMMSDDKDQLEADLDKARQFVKTDSYPMSIGEIVNMYENGEIILRPEYQRYFRWTAEQKSKLIESILIGLPLPSMFVAQDEKGNWEVVDGMQRLSTILDYMGALKKAATANEYYSEFSTLSEDLYYLPQFEGKRWDDLSRRIQLDFRRTKIQLTILLRETDLDAKFELFQRLNSGGTAISGQELRNAIMAGKNPEVLKWFEDLSRYPNFVSVCGMSERDLSIRMDVELVLRFVVFLTELITSLPKAKSVDVFLTKALREILEDNQFPLDDFGAKFRETFDVIQRCWGENALRYKTSPGSGKFSISFFEAVALGIAQNLGNLPSDAEIKAKIDSVGSTEAFKNSSGSGKNAQRRIPELVELGKTYFHA